MLPRAGPVLQEFAEHLAADLKRLQEDEETGSRSFRYFKTGTNHYSLAFTYDCIARSRDRRGATSFYARPTEPFWDPILNADF